MKLSAVCALAAWLSSASASVIPDVLERIEQLEQKIPSISPPPPKYFSKSQTGTYQTCLLSLVMNSRLTILQERQREFIAVIRHTHANP